MGLEGAIAGFVCCSAGLLFVGALLVVEVMSENDICQVQAVALYLLTVTLMWNQVRQADDVSLTIVVQALFSVAQGDRKNSSLLLRQHVFPEAKVWSMSASCCDSPIVLTLIECSPSCDPWCVLRLDASMFRNPQRVLISQEHGAWPELATDLQHTRPKQTNRRFLKPNMHTGLLRAHSI